MTGDKYETLLLVAQAVKSGLPLSEAIRLTVGGRNGRNDRKLLNLADLIDKGTEPQEAVRRAGLPNSMARLLDVALNSKDFAGTFDELAELEIGRSLTIHKMLQALTYPFLLLACSVITIFGLLIFTVPKFETLFSNFDVALPRMTVLLLQLSHWTNNPAWIIFLISFFLIVFFLIPFFFPRFWFCIPVFGHVGRCMYSSRLLRQLGGLIQRGVPLPEALEQCSLTCRNPAYRKECHAAATDAWGGISLPEIVVRYYWLFPTWLAPIIATDSSSESLVKSFKRAAETVDQQKDASILFIQVLSLPLFIMFTFSLVGFFVLAMFLPLIKLITTLSG